MYANVLQLTTKMSMKNANVLYFTISLFTLCADRLVRYLFVEMRLSNKFWNEVEANVHGWDTTDS